MTKKGGYQMVVLATLTYALALTYANCGKPLLIYDGVNKPYFADSIEVDENENVVIIRKGASSIVVESDDTKTFNNVLNGAILENIFDEDGNPRFIEGIATTTAIEKVEYTYNKWVLNGKHLMIVVAFNADLGSSWLGGQRLITIDNLPQWILDKIYPTGNNRILNNTIVGFDFDATSSENLTIYCSKISNEIVVTLSPLTVSAKRYFRMQIDLLID